MSQFPAFFKKISVPAWIGLGVAVAAVVWLCIYLSRPKPRAAELPVVAVMPVGKEDVSIYGEFAVVSAPSSLWRCGREWRATCRA